MPSPSERSAESAVPAEAPSGSVSAWSGLGAFFERLLAAHFLSYPLVFAAAIATLSLAIIGCKRQLLAVGPATMAGTEFQRWLSTTIELSPVDAMRFEIVMRPVAIVAASLLSLSHLGAIPWALAAREQKKNVELAVEGRAKLRRGFRVWLYASVLPTALIVLVGAAGWFWIALH